MKTYPTPHLEKLKATLVSNKLPPGDKLPVEKAIQLDEETVLDRGYF